MRRFPDDDFIHTFYSFRPSSKAMVLARNMPMTNFAPYLISLRRNMASLKLVAPVVSTSSTSKTHFPLNRSGWNSRLAVRSPFPCVPLYCARSDAATVIAPDTYPSAYGEIAFPTRISAGRTCGQSASYRVRCFSRVDAGTGTSTARCLFS